MKTDRASLWIILLLLIASTSFSQQQKWPNTLLWRISGNGLEKPSYLYGTMHLQDKRLFQFTDSVYHSLESVEGFALEIDFNELIDSLFSRQIRQKEDEYLADTEVEVDHINIDDSIKMVINDLDLKPGKISRKDLKRIRKYRMNKLVQRGEMKTIVDGYLYGIALRMDKWVGGIEDVKDQLDLEDEIGADLTEEEVFVSEKMLRSSLEELINIYINQDLESIAEYVDSRYNEGSKDILLYKRNIKMARRMDSLSKIRTMFFAVGAAHLPGQGGVIELLKEKGYTVSPVFSPQSISPEKFAERLKVLPWKKVENEMFSVEMPGVPQDYNVFGQVLNMKMYFDLSSMTFYMAGNALASNYDPDLDKAFLNVINQIGHQNKKLKTRKVNSGGAEGKEATLTSDGAFMRIRMLKKANTMYFLIAISTKKDNLDGDDVNKYYSSFTVKEQAGNKQWTQFTIPGKSFSIELPGIPKPNIAIDRKAIDTEWNFHTYDLTDNSSGLYYMLQVRDINKGYYLEGDSTYFSFYKQEMAASFDEIRQNEFFDFDGWPAFKLETFLKPNALFKIFTVMRGNRIYALIVGGSDDADFSDAEKVFNSFKLEEYPEHEWNRYLLNGFEVTAPEIPQLVENADPGQDHFISFDTTSSTSFEIFRSGLSPFFWASNDSIYLESQIDSYKNYYDSVINKRFVRNGNLKGIDYLLQQSGSNTVRKVRMLLNKDTIYTLVSFFPAQYASGKKFNSFFNDFRIENEIQPVIFNSKAKQILEALHAEDSATLWDAFSTIDQVEFAKEDIDLLHAALIDTYPYMEDYQTVNDKIAVALQPLADESTIRFFAEHYDSLKNEREVLKLNMLQVLAKYKTADSYSLFKKLLLNNPPRDGNAWSIYYSLRDSIELTQKMFPELLRLSSDSIMSEVVIDLAVLLLDSSRLKVSDIGSFRKDLITITRNKFKQVQQNPDTYFWSGTWINLLGHFNDRESIEILQSLSHSDNLEVTFTAIQKLLQMGLNVDQSEIIRLAENLSYRYSIYSELQKLNKLALFPASYASQVKIAESELWIYGTDDYDPSGLQFIGERSVEFKGTKQKFYLWKINYGDENETESFLGITGPYPLDGKEIMTDSKAIGIYWSEQLDASRLDAQFEKLLKQVETYMD